MQWNIPLYDDKVLWVVPGSHRRINTEEEDRQLLANPRVPLPGGIPVALNAGDGVVYILPIMHWGSNYSATLRRTIHGGYSNHTLYRDMSFMQYLSPASRAMFERWDRRSKQMQDETETTLRAAMAKDATAYREGLKRLHPGSGEKGMLLTTVFLSKAVYHIRVLKHPELAGVPDDLRRRGAASHAGTLNWGPPFADRFSIEEADALWERFQVVDARLQAEKAHFAPGFQSGPMRYFFNEMPADLTVESFVAGWR